MSATDRFFDQLENGQVETEPSQPSTHRSATDRYLDSLNLPKFEVPSKSEGSQPRAEIQRSIVESGIDAGKKLLKSPVTVAETALAMGTGGLAWTAGVAGAARETLGGLSRARDGEYARVPDESPEALARADEYKAHIVEQNLDHPAMQGLPVALRRSIMGRLAQGPTRAITPQEMEQRRQDLRETVQQMFTYAPRTEGAQQLTEVVVYPFEKLHEGSKVASKYWLNTMGVEGDPVAESLLTDALEIVAGAGIFAGAGMGARGVNRARIARRRKNVPQKVQKYLDTLDEFGEPKSALRRAAKDVRNWIKEQAQRHKDGEPLSQATVDKLMDLYGKYLRKRKDAPVSKSTTRGAKTHEQLNQAFLDTLDEFGELIEDPDYQRMMVSIEESRGTRSAPRRAEGEPLETPYSPDGESLDTPFVPKEPKATVGFKTAKGSEYQVHSDGTTTRNKAKRSDEGHEGDFGPKERSSMTIYVGREGQGLTPAGLVNPGKWKVVLHGDNTASLAMWNDRAGRYGISPSSRHIPYKTEPEIGLQPVELWKPDKEGRFHGVHLGNKIVEMEQGKNEPATRAGRTFVDDLAAEPAARPPAVTQTKGLKEFWEAEGKDFPEFKNRSHLYNWITAWRKKRGEAGFGGHANVPPEIARQAAQAYRDRVEVFDQVNAMRKAEGQRKYKRPTQITDEELVRVREREGTPDVGTVPRDVEPRAEELEAPRNTGPTPKEITGGRGVQEATSVSDTADALQPVEDGKVIRRRKGEETVVQEEGPPPEAPSVEEPPVPRKTETPLVYDRMLQDDVTYRRSRRRQNDADIEGRERLRPMEQQAADQGYLQRVRDLWFEGRERNEIGEMIGREFPEVARAAGYLNRSVAEHIDLDEMFNTAQYKKRKRSPGSVRQESSGSTAIDDLLSQLKPRDKKAGPNTPRAVVIIDPMLFRELWKGAKQSNVSLDTLLKNSGVKDPEERKHLVKMARQIRRDVEGLMDVSENLDSIPGRTGAIVNAKEVAKRQQADLESPIIYQGTFNMLHKAVNRAMDESGVVGGVEGFFEGLTTGKRLVQKVLGQAGLEIFWHPLHKAMASVTRELKASIKLMRATAKAYNIGKESSRKLAIFAVGERPGGLDVLKIMKVEPVKWAQLSDPEQAFYTAVRKRFDDLLERVNWAREKAGLEGLPKDKNYFPFLALAHKVKDPDVLLHQDLMAEFRQMSMKPDSHKPWFTFDRNEVGGPVELDFFNIYERYVHDSLWHINMTPLMGVFERLLNQSIDVKLLDDWQGNKTRKKTMADGTKKELPVTWQLKQSRGGRIKTTMSTYLKRVYGRYTQNVVSADRKAARIMENVAYEMSKNTAGYLVSGVSTAINQIPSVVNTIRETGVGPAARAVPLLVNRSAWQKAVNESQALYNRVGAFDAHLVDKRRATGTTPTQQRLASAYNTAQRGGEILSWPIRAAVEAVDSANVMLSYQAGKKLAADWGLKGQEAIRMAEQIMIDSQGSGTIADVSSIQSGKLTKALTTLQTMVISQFNQLTEGMLKHSEYGSIREKAPKGYQSFQQSFAMKNLRFLAAATVAGYLFEERLNMYSVMPNPLMAAKRVVDRGGDAKDMVEELFAEGVEAVPIAGSLKFDTYSMYGAAVPQMAGAVNSVGMVWDLWDAWMSAGDDPATAMVKAVGISIMEKPGGEVRGEAYFALAGIPVKQYIRVARQFYRGTEDDWQKLIMGYRFDELEARRAQRR